MKLSSKVLVECSHGHRFPVNLKKHTYRRHVFCPKCGEKVNVRKRIFGPNPEWKKQKEERARVRAHARALKRRTPKQEFPMVMPSVPGMSEVMGRVALIQYELERRKKQEEKEREQRSD